MVDKYQEVRDIIALAKEHLIDRIKVGDIEIVFNERIYRPTTAPKPKTAVDLKREKEEKDREYHDLLYGSV